MIYTNIADKKKIRILTYLNDKENIEIWNYLSKKLKDEEVKKGNIREYKDLSNSQILKLALKYLYDFFQDKYYIELNKIKKLEKKLIREKIELFKKKD